MNYNQTAAGLEAFDAWAKKRIAESPFWARAAEETEFQADREIIVEIIGTAILAVPTKEQPQ